MNRRPWAATTAKTFTAVGIKYPRLLGVLAHCSSIVNLEALPPPHGRVRLMRSRAALLPPALEGTKRSVLFLHNSYYHFYYLAQALRRRGWDALLVTMHSPQSAATQYYHGEDVNLFASDPFEMRAGLASVYEEVVRRFRMVHFAGMHHMSLFPANFDSRGSVNAVPWDFLALKARNIKLGYTISGCMDGLSQTGFQRHTGVCEKCIWQLHPDVCSDDLNGRWADKLRSLCDLVSVEADWALEYRCESLAFREPLTMCLDAELWRPDLIVPERFRIDKQEGEVVVLHGFGNKDSRAVRGRDIKGSDAVQAAVERLSQEGVRIRFLHPTNVQSRDMRYLQVQADIIVDQLNYGRYGAQAREGLMLGKPTVCYLDNRQGPGLLPLRSLRECPLVSASESTIYDVLKRLVSDAAERRRIGEASRRYAMKWHSADACALRFERVYDRLMLGLPPEADEVFDEPTERPCAA